jgi:hypothetical protein
MECVWHVIILREIRNAYTISVRKSEAKRPFRKPRRRWEYIIKTGLKYVAVISTGIIWQRLVTMTDFYGHDNEASDFLEGGKFLE